MKQRSHYISLLRGYVQCLVWFGLALGLRAGEVAKDEPPHQLRIATVGNSFHNWLPMVLQQVESLTPIKGHEQVANSYIGGSRVLDHWEVPDEKNTIKAALCAGGVDVLTLGARLTPDEGIEKFVTLGLAHNPQLRVTLQDIWLPFDRLDRFSDGAECYGPQANLLRDWSDPPPSSTDPKAALKETAAFNIPTAKQLERLHAVYFDKMDRYVVEENRKLGKQVLYVVPVGQAVIALRKLIADGKVPEIPKQSDLFADKLGHPKSVIRALSAYCHFAVIYHQSPVGLPLLPSLEREHFSAELNHLLQQLAWEKVSQHPSSGVSGGGVLTK